MSTYLQLCQNLRREVGAAGTGPTAVTGQTGEYLRIVNWIADADEMVQDMWEDWKFLWGTKQSTLVSGTGTYTAADFSITDLGAWDADSFVVDYAADTYIKLVPLAYEEWRDNYSLGTQTTGKPHRITIKPSNALVFYETPDDNYTVQMEYRKKRARLSANADTSAIPAQYHRIITSRAKMMYAEYEDAPEVYASAQQDYVMYLERLESNQLPGQSYKYTSQLDVPIVVRPE